MPASLQADFQGTAASFRNSLSNMPLLILAALVTVYIVLGVLYESFIPSDHHSFHTSIRRCRGFSRADPFRPGSRRRCHHRSRASDRHCQKDGMVVVVSRWMRSATTEKAPQMPSTRRAYWFFRPIMMTTMAALLGGLPWHSAAVLAPNFAGRSALLGAAERSRRFHRGRRFRPGPSRFPFRQSTGQGPLLVSEQLTFQKRIGECRAVDCSKRPRGSRASAMDRRDQLPGPAFRRAPARLNWKARPGRSALAVAQWALRPIMPCSARTCSSKRSFSARNQSRIAAFSQATAAMPARAVSN